MEHEIHNLISLDEVKHFLRITSDVDDSLIKDLLETAVFYLEGYLCRGIIGKTYEEVVTKSKEYLKYGPIFQIESVKSKSGEDVSYNLEGNVIESNSDGPLIVTYKGGMFTVKIPPEVKIALLEVVSHLYNSGAKESINSILSKLNQLRSYRL